MNELKIFEHHEFGKIRTIEIDGEPWMVGKDVATALGYADYKSALSDHVDEDDKRIIQRGQIAALEIPNRGMNFINESGLYSLVLSSNLLNAKTFRRWVTHDVLPSIRKTGSYSIPNMSKEMQAIFMLDHRTVDHDRRITALEENMVVDYGQQRTLASQVNTVVIDSLGGTESPAYRDRNVRGRVYSECNRDIQRWFRVNSRNNIPRKRFDEAVEYIQRWRPSTNMSMVIRQTNQQMRI